MGMDGSEINPGDLCQRFVQVSLSIDGFSPLERVFMQRSRWVGKDSEYGHSSVVQTASFQDWSCYQIETNGGSLQMD